MKKLSLPFLFAAIISFTSVNFAQSNIGILGGVDFPMGNFGDGASTGFGFAGTYEYMIISQLGLTGSVGYFHFGGADINTGFFASTGPSFNVIPIVVGARYYFIKGNVMPYGGMEVGIYITSTSTNNNNNFNGGILFKNSSLNSTPQFGQPQVEDPDGAHFGFAPYAGVRFIISPHVGIEGNVKFNIITGGGAPEVNNNGFFGTTSSSSTSILYFGINAGVFFLL